MRAEGLEARWSAVQERVSAAARRAGRDPADIVVVAVSKGRTVEEIAAAYALGLRDFGENRVAELRDKQQHLALPELRWHFIGRLQRRKVRDLVGHCDLIHSVDRLALAIALERRATVSGLRVAALLQLNVSGEVTKGGWRIGPGPEGAAWRRDLRTLAALEALQPRGLMTMAPFGADPEASRPIFRALAAEARDRREGGPPLPLDFLSMGMSGDFEVAVEEGATHIRVGTAIFGPRTTA